MKWFKLSLNTNETGKHSQDGKGRIWLLIEPRLISHSHIGSERAHYGQDIGS